MKIRSGILGTVLVTLALGLVAQTNTFPSSGNVGIGTTTPGAPLVVVNSTGYNYVTTLDSTVGTSGNAFLTVRGGTAGAKTSGVNLEIDSTNLWQLLTDNASGNLFSIQYTNTNHRYFSVLTNGNVGIGTTTPDGKLNITGAPNNWTANGWQKGIRLDGVHAIEFGGGAATKYGIGQSDNDLYFFDTTADDNSAAANYRMVLSAGNLGIGTTAPSQKLEVNGNIKLTSGSGGSITYADGTTQTTAWTGSLCGGDYAESVEVSGSKQSYEPGDVLVVSSDGVGEFAKSSQPYSTLVAGVYSTKPGLLGRRTTNPEQLKSQVPLAIVGIVPIKVTAENGPIKKGDLLVTSSLPGYAMKGTDASRMVGALIGKALGPLDSGTGTVQAIVSLQ